MIGKIESLKHEGKVIGFTASTFDLLHAGHVIMLEEAKEYCDYLIVGLLSDPTISRPDEKRKPIQSMFERYIQVQALEAVDMVIPFDTEHDLEDMLLCIMPDIRFVGEEYKGTNHTGSTIPDIEIMYNSRKHSFSTSSLRDRVIDAEAYDI